MTTLVWHSILGGQNLIFFFNVVNAGMQLFIRLFMSNNSSTCTIVFWYNTFLNEDSIFLAFFVISLVYMLSAVSMRIHYVWALGWFFYLGHAAMFIRICGLKLAKRILFPHCSAPNELSKIKSHAFSVSVKNSNLSQEV